MRFDRAVIVGPWVALAQVGNEQEAELARLRGEIQRRVEKDAVSTSSGNEKLDQKR